jgi:FkbM family methyltransferase
MGSFVLACLGRTARWARAAGLGRALALFVDCVDALLVRANAPLLGTKVDGVEFRGYLRHRNFLEYLARGTADESFYRTLLFDAVNGETTFVDAGAHIGLYTVLACSKARRVVAFEPDPYNVAALRRNVARCGCTNVETHAQALADRGGRAPFRAFRSTFSGSLIPRDVDDYREFEAELVSLDWVLNEGDLDNLVVKLDVEGAEPLAIAGMRDTIRRARSLTLFIEVNPQALETGGSSAKLVIETLLAADMECAWVDEEQRSLMPLREAGPLPKGNVVCEKHRERLRQ